MCVFVCIHILALFLDTDQYKVRKYNSMDQLQCIIWGLICFLLEIKCILVQLEVDRGSRAIIDRMREQFCSVFIGARRHIRKTIRTFDGKQLVNC